MRPNNPTIMNAVPATSSANSSVLDTAFTISASFQVISSNAGNAGTLQAQASNDPISTLTSGLLNTGQPSAPNSMNWTNIGTAATVTAGAPAMISIPQSTYAGYRWLRVTWTPTSGAGTITVNCLLIGYA